MKASQTKGHILNDSIYVNIHNKQSRLVVAREWGMTPQGYPVSFWNNEDILELVVMAAHYEYS